jgi:putative membrane protein
MGATPSEPPPGAVAGGEEPAGAEVTNAEWSRLHPLSWLFAMIGQLRPLVVPLAVLLFLGQGDWWELAAVAGAIGVGVASWVRSFAFRYRLTEEALVVREGILHRTERHVPLARVQNVVQRRNPLHRAFGVTELRLESAGGARPEAVMNVITVAEAERLEAILRGRAAAEAPQAGTERPLLSLAPAELVRLGLVTQRGMVVVGAALAFAMQIEPLREAVTAAPERLIATLARRGGALQGTTAGTILAAVLLGLLFLAALQVLSVARAFTGFYGFTLRRSGERITTVSGLFTRQVASARRDKIQRLIIGESLLSRLLGRQWLWCEVAAGAAPGEQERSVRLKWLAPLATPETIAALVAEVAPGVELAALSWRPPHPRAFRRILRKRLLAVAAVAALAAALRAVLLPAAALLLPWAVLGARGQVRFAGHAHERGVFAVRGGWLRRQWVLAWVEKGQGLALAASPFDRRHGMASVELDTAGATSLGPALRAAYLGEEQARRLAAELRAGL